MKDHTQAGSGARAVNTLHMKRGILRRQGMRPHTSCSYSADATELAANVRSLKTLLFLGCQTQQEHPALVMPVVFAPGFEAEIDALPCLGRASIRPYLHTFVNAYMWTCDLRRFHGRLFPCKSCLECGMLRGKLRVVAAKPCMCQP